MLYKITKFHTYDIFIYLFMDTISLVSLCFTTHTAMHDPAPAGLSCCFYGTLCIYVCSSLFILLLPLLYIDAFLFSFFLYLYYIQMFSWPCSCFIYVMYRYSPNLILALPMLGIDVFLISFLSFLYYMQIFSFLHFFSTYIIYMCLCQMEVCASLL